MSKKKNKFPFKVPSAKVDDQPATRGMLKLVRDELKEEFKLLRLEINQVKTASNEKYIHLNQKIEQLRLEFDQKIEQLRSEFSQKIEQLRSEFRSEIDQLRHEIGQLKVMVHRTNLLVEEQNANNRIVLEGLQAIWQRQNRLEGIET